MKKTLFITWCFISFVSISQLNAQCSNKLPKRPPQGYGDNRPATECELLFYRKNYPIIIKSFNKMEAYSPGNFNPQPNMGMEDWDTSSVTNGIYIHNFNVGLGSEKKFFQDFQNLNWTYNIKEDDEEYLKASNELANIWGNNGADSYYKELLEKVGVENMWKDSLVCKSLMLENELENRFSINISMKINISEDNFEYTHANFDLLSIQNCAYAIRVIKNKVITNTGDTEQADKNNHIDELHLYIGKWKAPQITKGKGFDVQNNFNFSQSKLSFQNVLVVIKCAPELQDEVMKLIDFNSLYNLIQL